VRVISYIKFINWKAGITKYSLFVGGDDVQIILEKCDQVLFEKVFW